MYDATYWVTLFQGVLRNSRQGRWISVGIYNVAPHPPAGFGERANVGKAPAAPPTLRFALSVF